MTSERKQEIVESLTNSLNECKRVWVNEVGDDFAEFCEAVEGMGAVYFESCDLTDSEREMINADATVSGELKVVLNYVLGKMWFNW